VHVHAVLTAAAVTPYPELGCPSSGCPLPSGGSDTLVCGVDASSLQYITFASACLANCQGAQVAHNGPCDPSDVDLFQLAAVPVAGGVPLDVSNSSAPGVASGSAQSASKATNTTTTNDESLDISGLITADSFARFAGEGYR
jgi:hypothetical protein